MAENILYEIKNLKKSYTKDKEILHDLSFQIPKGINCILGPNGTGKTTLIKCLLNLLNVNSGEIIFEGKNLNKWNKNEYYKKVSAVLEGNRNTYWYATGYENIKYFGYLKGLSLKEINGKSEILLKQFDLYKDKDKKVSNYSRGMQQKLAIIISLINNPDVLFLDEPTLGLDVESKHKMIEILEEISKTRTIILTTHQLDVVDRLLGNLLFMEDGKIIYEGKTLDFKGKFNDELLILEVYDSEKISENVFQNFEIQNKGEISEIIFNKKEISVSEMMGKIKENNLQFVSLKQKGASLEEIMINKEWKSEAFKFD